MIQRVKFLSSILVIGFLCLHPLPVTLAQNGVVEVIEICGNHHVSSKSIAKQIKTRPGQRYDAEQVKRDFEAVLAMGFFDPLKCKVSEENGPKGGRVITFNLSEYPDGKRRQK